MIPTDFNRARAAHSALQDFFAAHPKGKLERSALEHIHGLCHAAENAVSDDECRRAIRSIERYSALLRVRAAATRRGFRAPSRAKRARVVPQQPQGGRSAAAIALAVIKIKHFGVSVASMEAAEIRPNEDARETRLLD
jgi:hypothetical protein